MESGLAARLGLVAASVLAGLWLLTPTFMGKEAQERIEAAAERAKNPDLPAPATPDPWWVDWLPNKKVNLGLDLQGGIDLTLEVEVEEAVRGVVQRDVAPMRALAQEKGLALDDIRRDRVLAGVDVTPSPGTTLDAFTTFLRENYRNYDYAHTRGDTGKDVWVFTLKPEAQDEIRKRAVDQALENIRNRVDATGVKEPSITKKGQTAIDIQLPGETDLESAIAAIGKTGQLQFILVDENADLGKLQAGLAAAKSGMPADDYLSDELLSQWLVDNAYVPHGRVVLWEYEKGKNPQDDQRLRPYVLMDEVMLTGDDIQDARTGSDSSSGRYVVHLDFKPRGSQVFADVTGRNVGKRFGIVLDRQVRSAPTINERIAGSAQISMGGGNVDEQFKEASTLALVLRSGALPAPVTVGEHRTVGASLGQQAIDEGLRASAVGSILVLLFAAVYYRLSGLVADLALLINGLLVVALMAAAGATLTLPGICGIGLTIGMAVDCNIIIYERVREELREGKPVRTAISAGFDHAFVAVFDSNITTLLAGVVLYSYGSGPLRGFAVTLMIGIATTLFTGVFVSRALMELVHDGRKTTMSI